MSVSLDSLYCSLFVLTLVVSNSGISFCARASSHLIPSVLMSLEKPARLQVDPETIVDDDKPPQTGHTFNIWYLKWAGGDSSSRNYIKLRFRVNIKRDSGYTKASSNSPICLFFARGCCYKGKKCSYLHRLPSELDFGIPTQDCFGRDKTADYKDDMSGVGLLSRTNRTLYVSGIHVSDDTDSILTRHFLEFGAIDKIKVLHGKGSAFVSFRLEAEAQFAKEAMDAQSLDGSEVLSVRWANEDPNPNAQEETKRVAEERAMEAVKRLLKKQKVQKSLPKIEEKPMNSESKKNDAKRKITTSETEESKLGLLGAGRLEALRKLQKKQPTKLATRPLLDGYSSD